MKLQRKVVRLTKAWLFASVCILQMWTLPGAAQNDGAPSPLAPIDIPAGPLQDAILIISQAFAVDVLLPGNLVPNAPAKAVIQAKSPEEALTAVLRGTGLTFTVTDGAFVIARAAQRSGKNIEEVIVIGTPQSRYIVDITDPLSGLDLSFLENPRNVTVIPEQIVLDRKITDLNEALRNVPSFSEGDGAGGTNDDFSLRGFRRNSVYRNGFRRDAEVRTNLTNVAHTQISRGPATILYGQVEPGGAVDIVTKKPLDEARFAGELRYGEFDDWMGLIDWSQPIGDAAGLRLVASSQDAESFRDFYDVERDSVALSARVDLTQGTRIDLSYEWREEKRPLDRGSISVPTETGRRIVNDFLDVPISRRFGEPFEVSETEFDLYEVAITHQFSDAWSLTLAGAYQESTGFNLQARPRSVLVYAADASITDSGFLTGVATPKTVYSEPSDRVFLSRQIDGSFNRSRETVFADLLVKGRFSTGSVDHRISFGGDYRQADNASQRFVGATSNGITVPFFNIEQPIYGSLPNDVDVEDTPFQGADQKDKGVFFNDYLELSDRFGLLLGIRYSDTDDEFFFGSLTPGGTSASGWSPQAGLNYRLRDNVSLFASYSESFTPNRFITRNDRPVRADPEIGEQVEAGVKAEWFAGKLQTSLLIYSIEKINVIVGEEANGDTILADGQTSDGLEFSMVGQPLQGMNVTAAYAYTDSELDDGRRPRNVAEHTASLYVSYEVQSGALQQLGVAGGAYYSGNRFGDVNNPFNLGSYVVTDLSAWYTLPAPAFVQRDGTVRLQLAVKNLFDEDYYAAAGNTLRINIGPPRTFIASVSFDL
ncbi:MAG: TonB-dependent siderophore receptor [Pseudomonadota bacterium]